MAVHYKFKTETGTHERRLQIPESPSEKVHGETHPEENIQWLHDSEQQNIHDLVASGSVLYGTELVKVWTEKVK